MWFFYQGAKQGKDHYKIKMVQLAVKASAVLRLMWFGLYVLPFIGHFSSLCIQLYQNGMLW